MMSREDVIRKLDYFKWPEGDCWRFNGYLDRKSRSGKIRVSPTTCMWAHRLSAWVYLGYDLDDKSLQVLHKLICPHRDCFNPDHLYIGTPKDNVRDAKAVNRHNSGNRFCCRGHEFEVVGYYTWTSPKGYTIRSCKECKKLQGRLK